MRIAIGVCGLGYGHSLRQSAVVEALLARGHTVGMFGFGASSSFFRQRYGRLPCFDVIVPWIPSGPAGVHFAQASSHEWNLEPAVWSRNFQVMAQMDTALGGQPDLVISDYCPVSASYAYASGRPLVTLDNQSKFLGYQFPDIDGFSRQEERTRLGFFFPRAEARLATTFFSVPWPGDPMYPVSVIPPILREDVERLCAAPAACDRQLILVYLSPYAATRQSVAEVVRMLLTFPGFRFRVFAREAEWLETGNVRVQPFNDQEFLTMLARCRAIITNAGSNVLCEALRLRKPILAVPFRTYEQRYNASVIASGEFGDVADDLTTEVLARFLCTLDLYEENIVRELKTGALLMPGNGLQQTIDLLAARFGI